MRIMKDLYRELQYLAFRPICTGQLADSSKRKVMRVCQKNPRFLYTMRCNVLQIVEMAKGLEFDRSKLPRTSCNKSIALCSSN